MRASSTSYGHIRAALVVLLIAGATLFPPAAGAQQAGSAAQRRAQFNRVIDGLNSPDPATRLATLEQAVGGKDANLRRVALSTAFASSDTVLRSAALSAAIASASTFVAELSSAQGQGKRVLQATGGNLEVRIVRFDRATNTFMTSSRFTVAANGRASQGAVSGDRLSFSVALEQVFFECTGIARLEGSGTAMKGTMSCTFLNNTSDQEDYTITVDALR
jgi:hypothetical protein